MTRLPAPPTTSVAAALALLALAGLTLATQPAAACGTPLAVERSAGTGFSAVRLSDGTVWLDGRPGAASPRQLTQAPLLRDILQLVADGPRLYARQSDGRLWLWEPAGAALPRPVQGLAGKAVDVAVGEQGVLEVRVLRTVVAPDASLASPVSPARQQSVALRLAGPLALSKPGAPARYASAAAVGAMGPQAPRD